MSRLINSLKQEIEDQVKEIQSLDVLLDCAKQEVLKVGNHSYAATVQRRIEELLAFAKTYKKEAEDKMVAYANLQRKTSIDVMYFEAWTGRFGQDQMEDIQKDIQQFRTPPYMKSIDSGCSDEGVLYVSEDVDAKEAQAIWDTIMEFQCDEDGNLHWEYGDLLTWDGQEVKRT